MGNTHKGTHMTNDERAQAFCENESMYGWYCRTKDCPHCGHIPITLHELMNYHDFERVSGTPGQDRFVELRSDTASPSTVGLMHKVTDYSLVAWRPGSRGMVFQFQRNRKAIAEDARAQRDEERRMMRMRLER